MERLPPHVETIYLATPSLARDEILHAIADDLELRLTHERTTVALRELQEHLIRLYGAGRRVVVLIDEAHVMPEETLEQVRLLSNLESNRHKLMQLVLFGQPELDATLAKPSLRQLRDRITHAFRMRPLSAPEVAKYVSFRMRAAGYRGPDVFAPARWPGWHVPPAGSRAALTSLPTNRCSRPSLKTCTRSPSVTCARQSPTPNLPASGSHGGRPCTPARLLSPACSSARRFIGHFFHVR